MACRRLDLQPAFIRPNPWPGIPRAALPKETTLRFILSAALILSATSAFAQDAASTEEVPMLSGVAVNTSYNISAPMTAKTPEEAVTEEQSYRKQMYALSAKECADMLDTIAKTCTVTNITVSTQVNRSPGTPDSMYASGSVTMQVEMK
jgi:hypothetical protein